MTLCQPPLPEIVTYYLNYPIALMTCRYRICHSSYFFQVSIPFGGDQLANGNECERLGIGKSIPFFSLTEETLSEAVNKVLEDQSYLLRYVFF